MPIITRDEVKSFLNESTDDYNTAISVLIPVVTERLRLICNNSFTVKKDALLYVLPQAYGVFVASTKTVTVVGNDFASAMFAGGQDFFVEGSYLNDGYYEIDSVSTSALTILSAYSFRGAVAGTHSFKDESTAATIFFAVATWPRDIKPIVASMIQYDYQERGQYKDNADGVILGEYGYPRSILNALIDFTIPRYGGNRR